MEKVFGKISLRRTPGVVRVEGFEPPNHRVKSHYPMVSMAGFEPTHHGVKTHCLHHLTTWKYFAY